MFSRHRKARVLFGLSDVILAAIAFLAAYQTRAVLQLEHAFSLSPDKKVLVLGFTALAWVLGAEGSGLRRLTRESCDRIIGIPLQGSVESLNVSVATGICLYATRRARVLASR